jgi:uncharacterized protein (DUF305 family)
VRTRLLGLLLIAATGFVLAGCGGNEKSAMSETVTAASTVRFDRAFIDATVPHHEAALAMAKGAKNAGLSQPKLLQIANNIVITQQDEIDDMRQWRQQWFGSSAVDPRGAAELRLSEQEMGMQHVPDFSLVDDVDRAFASTMIEHHQGAVEMANLALERGQHPEIKELANSIIEAQEREIQIMSPHAGEMNHGG